LIYIITARLTFGISILIHSPLSLESYRKTDVEAEVVCKLRHAIEGRTDQRNAQINFSLINLLLFKLLQIN